MWDRVKSIFVSGVKFVVEVAKATFEVIKFAIKAAVWVVAGIFTIADHLTSYVSKILSNLFTPEKIVVLPKKKVPALIEFLEQEARNEGIAEDPEVLEISGQLKKAVDNQQALIYSIGKDNEGEVAVSDPVFISASQYDQKIADAEENNQIYSTKIRVAN